MLDHGGYWLYKLSTDITYYGYVCRVNMLDHGGYWLYKLSTDRSHTMDMSVVCVNMLDLDGYWLYKLSTDRLRTVISLSCQHAGPWWILVVQIVNRQITYYGYVCRVNMLDHGGYWLYKLSTDRSHTMDMYVCCCAKSCWTLLDCQLLP
ncbi:uncharacterized protein [Dysidea avara]|uniref:uncharacterized protein isoform X6 n=1 Tax=Dysidea avara TaxID=196820 RepID=UPI0033266C31